MTLNLIQPSIDLVPSYCRALGEGNFITMQLGYGDVPLAEIERDPSAYIDKITDTAPYSISLAGKRYTVLEHELLWIADGREFFGTVALRYKGDKEILEEYAGHIGLAIRPGLLNKGYGPLAIKKSMREIAQRFKDHGLDVIYATCDPANLPSVRVIEHFGGKLVQETADLFGTGPSRRYAFTLG